MVKWLLYGLLAWFFYNLVFRFIIPVYKTSRQLKKKFSEMQTGMQDAMNTQQPGDRAASSKKEATKKPKEDYIDFEEIR